MEKLTAVECLEKELEAMADCSKEFINIEVSKDYFKDLIKQAKEMERQAIVYAYEDGLYDDGYRYRDGEEYYNKNYNVE